MLRLLAVLVPLVLLVAACDDDGGSAGDTDDLPPAAQRTLVPPGEDVVVPNEQGIFTLYLAEGVYARLSDAAAYDIAWTADGESIWYATSYYPDLIGAEPDAPHEVRRLAASGGSDSFVHTLGEAGLTQLAPAENRIIFVEHEGTVDDASGARAAYSTHVFDGVGERDLGSAAKVDLDASGGRLLMQSPSCTNERLHLVEFPGGESTELLSDLTVTGFRWLADGRVAITYLEGDTPRGALLDVASNETIDLIDAFGVEPRGDYWISPDGAHLVYEASGATLLRDLRAGTEVDLEVSDVSSVEWNGDGTTFAYVSGGMVSVRGAGGEEIRAFVFEGAPTEPTEPTEAPAPPPSPFALRWSPDGNTLAVANVAFEPRDLCG